MNTLTSRELFLRLLQRAYSGELAAAVAYNGHWKSCQDVREREAIRQVEADEWHHRKNVGRMLVALNAKPRRVLEVRCRLVGLAAAIGCYITGRFMPMYMASLVETRNVIEYDRAAALAEQLGLGDFALELIAMGRVEKDHELFFQAACAGHRLLPLARKVLPGKVSNHQRQT